MPKPGISVVVPAFNEEKFLPRTLGSIRAAQKEFCQATGLGSEMIVVNNASTDHTAEIAEKEGALVVDHSLRNIASVRNAGIRAAQFSLVLTIDADCALPSHGLLEIWRVMQNQKVVGGALSVRVATEKLLIKAITYFVIKCVERFSGINGAMFFFWKEDALAFGGFPEDKLIAEDLGFARALKRLGRQRHQKFVLLTNVQVKTLERKGMGISENLSVFAVVMKAVSGREQRREELDYWYRPKR